MCVTNVPLYFEAFVNTVFLACASQVLTTIPRNPELFVALPEAHLVWKRHSPVAQAKFVCVCVCETKSPGHQQKELLATTLETRVVQIALVLGKMIHELIIVIAILLLARLDTISQVNPCLANG
jgi:hypothetical protein